MAMAFRYNSFRVSLHTTAKQYWNHGDWNWWVCNDYDVKPGLFSRSKAATFSGRKNLPEPCPIWNSSIGISTAICAAWVKRSMKNMENTRILFDLAGAIKYSIITKSKESQLVSQTWWSLGTMKSLKFCPSQTWLVEPSRCFELTTKSVVPAVLPLIFVSTR